MKRWKKYVFCVICACCVGLLAGCGNKNDGVTQNGKATEAMPETKENRTETPKAEINDKRATEPEETTVNDATDRSDADTGVGGAAQDYMGCPMERTSHFPEKIWLRPGRSPASVTENKRLKEEEQ